MEQWNREELYGEVWKQPLTKVSKKYGISDVMLAKICRKLQIPLPGRGYWARKAAGKPVSRKPLPKGKNIPVVHRYEHKAQARDPEPRMPPPEPSDAEYLRIKEIESRPIQVEAVENVHKLVATAERLLHKARTDDKGMLMRPWDRPCLDIRVSPGSLERALTIMNVVIVELEIEKFSVTAAGGKHGTVAKVFGQNVPFSIVEKYREASRREIQETPKWKRFAIEYQPSGELEFRVGEDRWGGWRRKDTKKVRLEGALPGLLGAILRDARARILHAEHERQLAIERHQKAMERLELSRQIEAEDKKVRQLDLWVADWVRAGQMRQFITALEGAWRERGHDLSAESEKGQLLFWMRSQADRVDPLVQSPPSILDRKAELSTY